MEKRPDLGRSARSVWLGILVASGLITVALAAPAVAHNDGTTSHLWADHIKLMKQPGTINTDSNPVDWTKLKGVPAGLADGVDDGVETAGFGLNKAFGSFFVDSSEIQRRVVGGCGPGRAIREIVEDGSIDCDPVSEGATFTDGNSGPICFDFCTEGSLTLAAGTWAISAKIIVYQYHPSEEQLSIHCMLDSGGLSDEAQFIGDVHMVTLPMQLLATPTRDGTASVTCRDFSIGDLRGRDLSIMAVRVGG